MRIEDESDERDPFEAFGDLDPAIEDDFIAEDPLEQEAVPVSEQTQPRVQTAFSWAGFIGGVTALVWLTATITGIMSYYGLESLATLEPMTQAGLAALAFAPALLFWLSASAAAEGLKARRLATELAQISRAPKASINAEQAQAIALSATVKSEIEALNNAVAAAIDRMAELEEAAQRNSAAFDGAVSESRTSVDAMSQALAREYEALMSVNASLKDQTQDVEHTVGRQVRLLREASSLVRTELEAAEEAIHGSLASFEAATNEMGDRAATLQTIVGDAATASSSLNNAMAQMLEGLAEATRLTETARKASHEAVVAANETASAMRETTQSAVLEAKRAAHFIQAESAAMREAANDTLAILKEAAGSARAASASSQVAAQEHAFAVRQVAGGGATRSLRVNVDHSGASKPAPRMAPVKTASASQRAQPQARSQARPQGGPRVFKNFGNWGGFRIQQDEAPTPANETTPELMHFTAPAKSPDATLQEAVVDLVFKAGVDLDAVLAARELETIARASATGGSVARRDAVRDAAADAVQRIRRRLSRDGDAMEQARRFRNRPELAKSHRKNEDRDLIRAYLLIDAALS